MFFPVASLVSTRHQEKQLEADLARVCGFQDTRVARWKATRPEQEQLYQSHAPEASLSLCFLPPPRANGVVAIPLWCSEHPLPQAQLPILLYVLAMMRHEPDLLQPERRRSATCPPPFPTSRDPQYDGGVVALTSPRLVTERCSGRLSSSSSGSSGLNSNAPRTFPQSSRCFKALSSRLILTDHPHLPPSS